MPTDHGFDLIISDIDGCLCPESTAPFDVDSLALLAEHNRIAQEQHDRPVITLCSGRPQPFAEAICRLLANRGTPCVCENGVWVYDPGTNVYTMDPAITRDQLTAVRAAGDWLQTAYGPRGVTQQPGKAASVSLYHRDPEYLKSIVPELRERFEREAWPLRVSMTWYYINCDLAHVSKGTGIERLLAPRPVPRERLAGIGDTTSDLAIRERVGFFGCPSNAAEELKRVADYVSPHPETRGVVDIVQRIVAKVA